MRFALPADRCQRCAVRVPAGTTVCGDCLRDPPPFFAAFAAVDYGHPWDRLLSDFKFNAALDLAGTLGRLLAESITAADADRPDLLLPVPLSAQRLRERGYNQSWELARRCARHLDCRTDTALLRRVKDTPHQLSLPRGQRLANVQGAFDVDPRRGSTLLGRRVALVDDVMTTQATARELAQVLLAAGTRDVQVWVVARTPPAGH